MATLPDITIPSNDFVSLNTLTGIAVGTPFDAVLKSTHPVLLHEANSKPLASNRDGRFLLNMNTSYAIAEFPVGSLEIWAICLTEGSTSKLNCGEI